MTPKERWLATIKMQPVDRLVFWPKILNEAYTQAQKAPFNKMSIPELHEWIGSDIQVFVPNYLRTVHKNSSSEVKQDGDMLYTTYKTKYGNTEGVLKFDPPSCSWHPIKMAIQDKDDLQIITEWFSDSEVELDSDKLEKVQAYANEIGDRALVADNIGESPLMDYIEWLAGVENGHYLLYDHKDEVEGLFNTMHRLLIEKTKIAAEYSPGDVLYFTENTSTTLISVEQFRNYCFKHLQDYADIIKGNDKIFCLHMCGHLKALLPDMAMLKADAFEAFTSPPVGNTTLLDGRNACPDKCFIGGTNATLWIQKPETIIEQLEHDLNVLPHHRGIAVSSAGVMPPLCSPETIREVCDWVKNYKVIV